MKQTVVLALGGNALIRAGQAGTHDDQQANALGMARAICGLLDDGCGVVVVHGNGPQVGALALQQEEGAGLVPPQPLFSLGAMTQGQLGSLLGLSLRNACAGRDVPVASLVTHVLVDPADAAFAHPTKPIGPFFPPRRAKALAAGRGWTVGEDAGRGHRRLVASPEPQAILEADAIRTLADAGFVVVAQRRLRQLGMLAAIGATQRQLRLVLLANGATVGAIAAVAGTALAVAGWIAVAPRLEGPTHHRIDRFDLPWWLLGAGMLLAVVTATAAAWWPARTVARVPVILALSARPPQPRPARRSAVAAGLLAVIGVVCLAVGIDPRRDQANPVLVVSGTVAVVLAILLAGPLAIRVLAVAAARSPISARLALRDLARYQARSGAALAAISLALGIAVAAVVAAAAAEHTAGEGNLSDRQLLFRIGDAEPLIPERTPAELARLRSEVDRLAATLDRAAVVALDAAVDPGNREGRGGQALRPAVVLARQVGEHTLRDIGVLYVATPELLAHLGVDQGKVDPDTDVLTPHTGHLGFANLPNHSEAAPDGGKEVAPSVKTVDLPAYTSAPTSLITTNGLRRGHWQPARAGWLVQARRPPTAAQLAQARRVAADAGMTVETRDRQPELTAIRSGATAAGMLLALGILAMTVGLIRGEAAGDLRTLSAAGATGTTRRNMTAATGGALALLGVLLGAVGAYLALTAGYHDDLGALRRVPIGHLAVMLAGLPLAAAAAGWLLAGREPPALARQPME